MQDILIVVDMQNDFIDGALGTKEAQNIVPLVVEKIKSFKGKVYYTKDTHFDNYLTTQEGKLLPVKHCVKGEKGWELNSQIEALRKTTCIEKLTFGSKELIDILQKEKPIKTITFVGLCTDICVISNAILVKAYFPEIQIIVDASCCAGVTIQSHKNALESMRMCQINVIND